MKKKISFKLFCTVLGRGIWQAICWIGTLFGFKDGSRFGKVVKRIVQCCLVLILVMITLGGCIFMYDELSYRFEKGKRSDAYSDDYRYDKYEQQLGKNFTYVWYTHGGKPGYVKDNVTGNILLKDLVWLVESQDGDSLAVYKTNADKRGYFNRFTGEVMEPVYDKAWIYSEGLALVMKDGDLYFIDHQGNKVFDKTFPYPTKNDGYCFHGNYCAVENNQGWTGLIDRTGNWVIEPKYDDIRYEGNDLWRVDEGENSGVMNQDLELILPIEYQHLYFDHNGNNGIFASKDGERKLYDYNGNIKEDMVILDAEKLYYETGEYNYDNYPIMGETLCYRYNIGDRYYGLMDKNGKPLTKGIYNSIKAITPNTFLCEVANEEYVILDQYGKQVRQPLSH